MGRNIHMCRGRTIRLGECSDCGELEALVEQLEKEVHDIEEFIGDLDAVQIEVVDQLPDVGASNTIYLVPKEDPQAGDTKDEYIWINNAWELIGNTDIDLSQYVNVTTYTNDMNDIDGRLDALEGSHVADVQVNGTSVVDSNHVANVTVPTQTSDLINNSGYITSSSLATVATTGDYDDLTNKPTIPTVNDATLTIQKNGTDVETFTANSSTNKTANITVPTATSDLNNDSGFIDGSGLATVATTGDYDDLIDKPSLATVATTGDYDDLTDKPTIPTVNDATLTIQKNGTDVQTFTANASSNATANITVPTATSELNNDSDFVSDASYVHTDNNFTNTNKNNLTTLYNNFGTVQIGNGTITAGNTSSATVGFVYFYQAYDVATGEAVMVDAKHLSTNPPMTQFTVSEAHTNDIMIIYMKGNAI